MGDETEYKKLSVEDRCIHKVWKARVDGYEEAAKLFREIEEEKGPEWTKFVPLMKKMVIDSNAMAQEKGLEATLIFVENCGHAGKTANEVMNGIVQKCIAAPKTKTKDLAVQITLMYIEIEKQEAVIEELVKGMDHKNPKIVAACVAACTLALKDFGARVINSKPLIKKLAPLMSNRDVCVREEGKQLAIEIYRWIGSAMKQQISSLPQVTIKELEDEFDKLKGERAEPTRYLRSQQERIQQQKALSNGDTGDGNDEDVYVESTEIDPMSLIDPVDILSKITREFYEKLEEKKWTTRKEALEMLEKLLTENLKLENGDYSSLVNALKKVITKDTNVVLVAIAGKCLAMLARGLGKRFGMYSMVCVPFLLEKFKEKKANVVTALRDALDSIYPSTSLEAIQEHVLEALNNKNPNVKAETASFLARAFANTQPSSITKKLLKVLVAALIKTINESDPTVRDCSAEALGTLLKLMGEKQVGPFLMDVDALKMAKIKEFEEKAEIKVKSAIGGGVKRERATGGATAPSATATNKKPASANAASRGNGADSKQGPTRNAATNAKGKKLNANDAAVNGVGGGAASRGGQSSKNMNETEMSEEDVRAKAEELFSAKDLLGLCDSNWKNRLAAVESILQQIDQFDARTPGLAQILIRTISGRKPGLKEMNFQVLKLKFDIIRMLVEKYPISYVTIDLVINEITEKLADIKNGSGAADILTAFAEATKFDYVVNKVLGFAFEQKSPKLQSEALNWLSKAILEFGFQLQLKHIIDDIRKGVQSTNPMVRTAAISLIGTISMYGENNIVTYFDSEKPVIRSQIQAEVDKAANETAPQATRNVKKQTTEAMNTGNATTAANNSSNTPSSGGGGGTGYDDYNEKEVDTAAAGNGGMSDVLRVDISSQLTESLLKDICDKDWKTRYEGLTKLQNIITEAKAIKSSIGDLPVILAQRIVDSNAKIAQLALTICEQLATSMDTISKNHIRILLPELFHALGDSKIYVRTAALNCITVIGEKAGYKEFFEGEMISDALKTGTPILKVELWAWLATHLPDISPKSVSKEELTHILPHLYANICDRNVDVRKNANDAVVGVMIHVGYETMVKALDKLKPATKKDILVTLDKARPNLPIKPLPKTKQLPQSSASEETKKMNRNSSIGSPNNGSSANKSSANAKGNNGSKVPTSATTRKKEEAVEYAPLMAVNNIKNQRHIDEQKMRILKWSFITPREEFIELLREQMLTANMDKTAVANMFHEDFRYHLRVIESLMNDLPQNLKALICNLDLILKWLSLRFYDTNPSVLLKGLEYLNQVFSSLQENRYSLTEYEASAFIPHLISKLGDPKDAVRLGVKGLLRKIIDVYSNQKVFSFVLEGLKSKNARQRAECLDELDYMIETYGLTVCQPSQQVALKDIARYISDRDNNVRSAALNCIVKAYFVAGDRIYKLIGQLTEKDMSMLDERIKRTKQRPPKKSLDGVNQNKSPGELIPPLQQQQQQTLVSDDSLSNNNDDDILHSDDIQQSKEYADSDTKERENEQEREGMGEGEKEGVCRIISEDDNEENASLLPSQAAFEQQPVLTPPISTTSTGQLQEQLQQQQPPPPSLKPSGPFGLNQNVITDIEKDWVRADQMTYIEHPRADVAFLFEPIVVLPTKDGFQYPQEKFEQLLTRSRQIQHTLTTSSSAAALSLLKGNISPYLSGNSQQEQNNKLTELLPKHDPHLIKIIKAISSFDTLNARAAIRELSEIVDSTDKQAVLKDYEELFIQSVLEQLRNLSQLPLSESLTVYRPLLSILYTFFHSKILGTTLSIIGIKNLMSSLLHLIADQKLNTSDEAQYNMVINGICLRILDKSNFTNLNCALIRLLRETCYSAGLPKFTDLLMKCLWRNIKAFPDRVGDLDYELVFMELYEFLLELPSSWWQNRPSDTPFRTIKTIILNMVKLKGNAVLPHLIQIPRHSELHGYVIKILKSLQKDGTIPSVSTKDIGQPSDIQTKQRSTCNVHDTMSHIFKYISCKETKQYGLQKLYNFKVQNPEVDIDVFLKGASPSFQKYIEESLAEYEAKSAELAGVESKNPPGLTMGDEDDENNRDPDFWISHLNQMRLKANLKLYAEEEGAVIMDIDNKTLDEKYNLSKVKAEKMQEASKEQEPEMSPNRLQHLQAKLAQIKKENQT